jgi:hypothetical protein
MSSEPSSAPVVDAASDRTANPAFGLIGLFAVIIGIVLMVVGFLAGLDAAFSGNGPVASIYTGVFILGSLLVLGGLISAIVRVVKGRTRALSIVTIVLSLLPIVAVIVLRLSVTGAFS